MALDWNYRIMAHKENGRVYFQMHEVYYKGGKPHLYSEEPVSITGDTLEEMELCLKYMQMAFTKPVIWAGENFPQEFKEDLKK